MTLRRLRPRCLTALVAVFALLYAQLALATYRCPSPDNTAAMARMMANGEPCAGMDAVQPVLCHQHAENAAQSFEPIKLPAATVPAVVQVLVQPVVPLAADRATAQRGSIEQRPPPDPVYLATRRLRV